MQKYNDISNIVDLRELKQKINQNFQTLKSGFSGSDFPDDPITGQICIKDNVKYIYNGSVWNAFSNTEHTHDDIYDAKAEIDTFMAGKLSTSGTAYNASTYRSLYWPGGMGKVWIRSGQDDEIGPGDYTAGLLCANYSNYSD